MSLGKLTYDNTFNKPVFWVDEFLINNYMVSSNRRANKQQMYRRYKDYAIKHNKGKLTLEEFHNVITKQRHIECIKVQGKEYYTNCEYEPIDPNDGAFWRYENCIIPKDKRQCTSCRVIKALEDFKDNDNYCQKCLEMEEKEKVSKMTDEEKDEYYKIKKLKQIWKTVWLRS